MLFTAAAALFAVAVVVGSTMAVIHFRGRLPPLPLVAIHGLFAAAGLVGLLLALGNGPGFSGLGGISFLIFLLAAIGGFFLFAQHLFRSLLPSSLVLIHGAAALIAFLLLLAAATGAA